MGGASKAHDVVDLSDPLPEALTAILGLGLGSLWGMLLLSCRPMTLMLVQQQFPEAVALVRALAPHRFLASQHF